MPGFSIAFDPGQDWKRIYLIFWEVNFFRFNNLITVFYSILHPIYQFQKKNAVHPKKYGRIGTITWSFTCFLTSNTLTLEGIFLLKIWNQKLKENEKKYTIHFGFSLGYYI